MQPVIEPAARDGAERWTRGAAVELAVSFAALVITLAVFARFTAWVETRPGVVIPDLILAHLRPRDVTWITFGLLHSALAIGVVSLLGKPRALALAMRSYAVMVLLRLIAMALLPLDPPPGTIPLQDPLVELLGTSGQVLTRDLFFSGHTATMCILTLCVRDRRLKWLFFAGTIGVAACVLWQAVHYTIDVVAAPAFAYAAHRLALSARALGQATDVAPRTDASGRRASTADRAVLDAVPAGQGGDRGRD